MENMRYVDKLGRGLPMVCREVERSGGSVSFTELGEEFRVVISFKQATTGKAIVENSCDG